MIYKVEKFLVLEGDALIRLRNMGTGERVEYPVHGEDWKVVDIPPGWTHSIQNVGDVRHDRAILGERGLRR